MGRRLRGRRPLSVGTTGPQIGPTITAPASKHHSRAVSLGSLAGSNHPRSFEMHLRSAPVSAVVSWQLGPAQVLAIADIRAAFASEKTLALDSDA